ncbi:zinc ribbon domain-containing protein [Corynebacterium vitaeruminis]|uniref:zinc ribbon domain-containing protein n=1 Tax=Corynebacterium vitaeruminis TaxID=38305 RepID=UPI0023F00108|nr:C4-type zinc ribbon domain-containing protein [Corynebacterium vitaeruminis]
MKLSIDEQKTLLELATTLRNGEAAPAAGSKAQQELDAAKKEHARLVEASGSAQLAVDDMELEILRIQEDERKLRRRAADDKVQLGAASDIEQRRDLEHDLYAAKSRIADLMSELQEAHNEIHALRNNADLCAQRVKEDQKKLEALEAKLAENDSAATAADREERIGELREELPDEILVTFDERRLENGVGVAAFNGRSCGGCFIVLPPADLSAIRQAAPEEMPECPECGTFLVRNA